MAPVITTINAEQCASACTNVAHSPDCRFAERERELWAIAIAQMGIAALIRVARLAESTHPSEGQVSG